MAQKVVVFGATGFVGSKVMKRLSALGVPAVGVSRSGLQPHAMTKGLKGGALPGVEWVRGNAGKVESLPEALFEGATAVVSLIGSSPIPYLTESGFAHQVHMNGTTNANVIAEAKRHGVKRVVLLNASVPPPLQCDKFGYYVGKREAAEALERYVTAAEDAEGVLLQPAVIYGERYLPFSAQPVDLTPFFAPFHAIQEAVKRSKLPFVSEVEALVSADQVVTALEHYATAPEPINPRLLVLKNDAIVNFAKAA
eukprot:TRINITY_DN27353_c0_g1_i1.p1 TRINITY_DN27353_c0_g1~~TRINITY_DN27353_c0_g1_i1.p1  ORF type:complete len:271 (+),score=99.90 TRINITY_DN27353_c0_g1_i1:55-813(+)